MPIRKFFAITELTCLESSRGAWPQTVVRMIAVNTGNCVSTEEECSVHEVGWKEAWKASYRTGGLKSNS